MPGQAAGGGLGWPGGHWNVEAVLACLAPFLHARRGSRRRRQPLRRARPPRARARRKLPSASCAAASEHGGEGRQP